MSGKTFTDEDDRTLFIGTCDGRSLAVLRVDDGDRAEVCVSAADLPALAARLYEACGLRAPVILERPEGPDTTALPGVLFTLGRPGFVDVKTSAGGRWNISSAALRHYAASLAMLADEADAVLDPAEVDALAAAIMAELNPGAMGLDGARPYARAALRWMREREARDE